MTVVVHPLLRTKGLVSSRKLRGGGINSPSSARGEQLLVQGYVRNGNHLVSFN